MRKTFFAISMLCMLTGIALLLGGCGINDPETGRFLILSVEDMSRESVGKHQRDPLESLTIGGITYELTYEDSEISSLDDHVLDRYYVKTQHPVACSVLIDPDSGQPVSFFGMCFSESFPQINGIEDMNDEEMRAAAEQVYGDWIDFTPYNDFMLFRAAMASLNTTTYTLQWCVKRELLCNINVALYLTADGKVCGFNINDSCPDALDDKFATAEQRTAVLEEGLCEEWGIDTLDGSAYSYEVMEEMHCYFKGKNAIRYLLKIDVPGRRELITAVIY